MKKCNNCGAMVPDGAMFCSNCGQSLNNEEYTTVLNEDAFDEGTTVLNSDDNFSGNKYYPPLQTSSFQTSAQQNPNVLNQPVAQMTLEQFFDKFASKKTKNWHRTIAFICIFTALLSLVLLVMGNYLSVIDVIFYIVFGILLLKKKSWVFPLIVTCYGGLFTIIGLLNNSTPSGIFACVVAILATIGAKKVNDAYKVYITTGQIPNTEI